MITLLVLLSLVVLLVLPVIMVLVGLAVALRVPDFELRLNPSKRPKLKYIKGGRE